MKITAGLVAILTTVAVLPINAQAKASNAQPRSIDNVPCPPMPVVSPERMRLIVEPKPHITKTAPASERNRICYMNWSTLDPDGVCRYQEENRSLPRVSNHRVIFLGDSITEAWKPSVPSLFLGDVLDHGASGQTTTQMLARFRADESTFIRRPFRSWAE